MGNLGGYNSHRLACHSTPWLPPFCCTAGMRRQGKLAERMHGSFSICIPPHTYMPLKHVCSQFRSGPFSSGVMRHSTLADYTGAFITTTLFWRWL